MNYIAMEPPGTLCFYSALDQMLNEIKGSTFLDVGCGGGDISLRLLKRGLSGTGVDFSSRAIEIASVKLKEYIDANKYNLINGDIFDDLCDNNNYDIVMSYLVMEHIEKDVDFLNILRSKVKPGGTVIIAVPGRSDKWSLEDETVGHLRRYERDEILEKFTDLGFVNCKAWSVAVPIGNILFGLSNYLVSRSSETQKQQMSKMEQTMESGIRQIPYKTVFPAYFKLFLNPYSLFPFFQFQKLFYQTNLGLTVLVSGEKPQESLIGVKQ